MKPSPLMILIINECKQKAGKILAGKVLSGEGSPAWNVDSSCVAGNKKSSC